VPVVVALLAISLKLVTMSWFSSRGAAAYADGRYGESVGNYGHLQVLNVVDPWRAHAGEGSARYRQGDLIGAEAAFRQALEHDPQRCDVRFNLAVTIEAQGDRLTGGAQREVEETEREDGLARYRVALDIADAGLCPSSVVGEAGTRLDEARARLRAKLGAEQSGEGEEIEAPEQRQEQQSGEENPDAEQEINDRNQAGAAEREDVSDLDPAQFQDENTSNW
jgi:Flp pilus assembly protein TadD